MSVGIAGRIFAACIAAAAWLVSLSSSPIYIAPTRL